MIESPVERIGATLMIWCDKGIQCRQRHQATKRRPADRPQPIEAFVLALVETWVRNTQLEFFHAGRVPQSATGDYADVTVLTPLVKSPVTISPIFPIPK